MNGNIKGLMLGALTTALLSGCGSEDDLGTSAGVSCAELDSGVQYVSEALYESGFTPDGVSLGHWTVAFEDGQITTQQSDYREAGTYSCEGSRVFADFGQSETVLQFSADMNYLYNHPSLGQKLTYKKRAAGDDPNPELCSAVAGKSYVDASSINPGGPADIQLAANFARFDDSGTVSINLLGTSVAEALYNCEFSQLHIHTDAEDTTPILGQLDGSTLVLTMGEVKISMIESGTEGEVCADVYAPVCSATPIQCIAEPCDDGVYETYSNLCESDTANAVFQSEGECGELEGRPWNREDEQVFCPAVFDPVCAINTNIQCVTEPCPDGLYETFSNNCEMAKVDAIEQFPGECGDLEGEPWEDQVLCPAVYEPVCGVNTNIQCVTEPCPEGIYQTYSNSCELAAQDGLLQFEDECGEMEGQVWSSDEPIFCTLELAPVCGGVSSSEPCGALPCPKMTHQTFGNDCMLAGAGTLELFSGECGEKEDTPVTEIAGDCDLQYDPVCGKKETGIVCVTAPCESAEYKTYGNFCTLGLDRAQQVFTGECGDLEGEITTNEPAVYVVPEYPTFPAGNPVNVTAASIDGDLLSVSLAHSGCQAIHYDLYVSSSFAEVAIPITNAVFVPMGDAGDCEALFTTDFVYDLLPLKQTFINMYPVNSGEFTLQVGSESLSYTF